MKVSVCEVAEWEHQACLRLQPQHRVECLKGPLTAENVAQHANAEVVTTFIRSDLSKHVLEHLPRLGLIAARSTGFDHIDLDYCRRTGITVCNVPDYADHTVAEHAFALVLALRRHLVEAADRTRRGDFSTAGLRDFELAGKTLGVVGMGRIGRRVATIGRGFGMTVMGYDPKPDALAAETLGLRYTTLEELLTRSDVVTLNVPGGGARGA